MKKLYLSLVIIIAGCFCLSAQVYEMNPKKSSVWDMFEFEVTNLGTVWAPKRTILLDGCRQASRTRPGLSTGMEIRFNLPKTPFSLGLGGTFSSFIRQWTDTRTYDGVPTDEVKDIRARGIVGALQLTADYNFHNDSDFNWFIGLAYGYSVSSYDFSLLWHFGLEESGRVRDIDIGKYNKNGFNIVTARCGMEYKNVLRLTVYCNYITRELFYFGISAGVVMSRER